MEEKRLVVMVEAVADTGKGSEDDRLHSQQFSQGQNFELFQSSL